MQNIDFTASQDHQLINDLRKQCSDLQTRIDKVENDKGKYIVNTDPSSGKFHSLLFDSATLPPAEWRTRCGWKYGHSQFAVVQTLTSSWRMICATCLPLERLAMKPRDDNSDNDVSSCSSSSSHDSSP